MKVATYDSACYDLAEHFLQNEPCSNDPELLAKHANDLAETIQRAVEDWFVSPGDGCETPLSAEPQPNSDRKSQS